MNRAFGVLLLATALLVAIAQAQAKEARCVLKQNSLVAFAGRCQFRPENSGSFSIQRPGGEPMLPSITNISVTVVAPGIAEVRGLTTHGNNSLWGQAIRSKKDRACWTGPDFEICAY
jgi:hypothetical protein